jgi:hypothetical protein
MMEPVIASETSSISTRLHIPISQTTVNFILAAMRTWDLTSHHISIIFGTADIN